MGPCFLGVIEPKVAQDLSEEENIPRNFVGLYC